MTLVALACYMICIQFEGAAQDYVELRVPSLQYFA
jgi:hypothetical protein